MRERGLKVCILGESAGRDDEAMRKIAVRLTNLLIPMHDVLSLSPNLAFTKAFWQKIKNHAPDLIHYIPGPSIKSFVLMKMTSMVCPDAKTLMSAPYPVIRPWAAPLLEFLKPNLILAQSQRMARIFKSWGMPTIHLPICGVDLDLFRPSSTAQKRALRKVFGFDAEQFIALHVGHLKLERNVQALEALQLRGVQTLIVGSTSTGMDTSLVRKLEACGSRVITEFQPRIHEIFRVSDCYIFPTSAESRPAAIEIPLSVLEAASCNLPIVATRFGALPEIFEGVAGFTFLDPGRDLFELVVKIRDREWPVDTRSNVRSFSWRNIVQKLVRVYREIVQGSLALEQVHRSPT